MIYKVYPNWCLDSCSPFWTKSNQSGKGDFDPVVALVMHNVFHCACGQAIESDCGVWFASIDSCQASDHIMTISIIHHSPRLLHALKSKASFNRLHRFSEHFVFTTNRVCRWQSCFPIRRGKNEVMSAAPFRYCRIITRNQAMECTSARPWHQVSRCRQIDPHSLC